MEAVLASLEESFDDSRMPDNLDNVLEANLVMESVLVYYDDSTHFGYTFKIKRMASTKEFTQQWQLRRPL